VGPGLSEDDLIATFFAPIAGAGGLGLKDDAALVAPRPGHELVVTVDALVAGVHFFASDPPASIGRKALGVNLSDLAAKGAEPTGFLLTLALPGDWSSDWLEAFAKGLGEAASQGECALLGGDTVRTPGPLTLSITAFGEVPAGTMVRRTTARPGDAVLVSGTIGDGALGLIAHGGPEAGWLRQIKPNDRAWLADRYLHPQPRQALAPILRRHASAAMDVSDGLVGDARKMMRAAGVGATIDLARVPLSQAARAAIMADPSCMMLAMTGGDDYELLCTVPPCQIAAVQSAAMSAGIPLTKIGSVTAAGSITEFRRDDEIVEVGTGSFSHF
jgi:thiamine-monophosphate kinase